MAECRVRERLRELVATSCEHELDYDPSIMVGVGVNATIYRKRIADLDVVLKIPRHFDSMMHPEYQVGLRLNSLECSNFATIYAMYGIDRTGRVILDPQDGSETRDIIILQYIPGLTLEKYLTSNEVSMRVVLSAILQTLSAINVADQVLSGFRHGDLSPGNIVLRPLQSISQHYHYDSRTIVAYQFEAVIIDYGASKIGTDRSPPIADCVRLFTLVSLALEPTRSTYAAYTIRGLLDRTLKQFGIDGDNTKFGNILPPESSQIKMSEVIDVLIKVALEYGVPRDMIVID